MLARVRLVSMGGIMLVRNSPAWATEREERRHDRGTEGGPGPTGGRALLCAVRFAGRRRGWLCGGRAAGGDQRGGAPELEADQRDARPYDRRRHPGVGHVGVLLRVGRFANRAHRLQDLFAGRHYHWWKTF